MLRFLRTMTGFCLCGSVFAGVITHQAVVLGVDSHLIGVAVGLAVGLMWAAVPRKDM